MLFFLLLTSSDCQFRDIKNSMLSCTQTAHLMADRQICKTPEIFDKFSDRKSRAATMKPDPSVTALLYGTYPSSCLCQMKVFLGIFWLKFTSTATSLCKWCPGPSRV